MDEKKELSDFRNTGLLVFVNTFLNIFGWCLIVKSGHLVPIHTISKGFPDDIMMDAYRKVSEYNCNMAEVTRVEGDFHVYKPDED